jgi:hypothetical protein
MSLGKIIQFGKNSFGVCLKPREVICYIFKKELEAKGYFLICYEIIAYS